MSISIDSLALASETPGRVDLIQNARGHVVDALSSVRSDWTRRPSVGPHPRDGAIYWAREAAEQLSTVLSVEAPRDVIVDTQHALDELNQAIDTLATFDASTTLAQREQPLRNFEQALDLLVRVEERLNDPGHIGIP